MPHDVFISHSSSDKPTADAICASLEREKLRCWIAPRDILPGKHWGEAIVEAIEASKLMVVVLSQSSNESAQVMREVERAVHNGVVIIPFRVDDVSLSKSLEFFLSTPHWLDALTPPLESHIQKLAKTARDLLRNHQAACATAPPTALRSGPNAVEIDADEIPPDQWDTSDKPSVIMRFWRYLTHERT